MFLSCHLYDGSYLVPADARELSDTVISFLLNNKTCFLQVKKELKLDRVSTVDNVKQSRESQTRQKFHLCFGLIRVVPLQKKVLAAIFLDSKPDFFHSQQIFNVRRKVFEQRRNDFGRNSKRFKMFLGDLRHKNSPN